MSTDEAIYFHYHAVLITYCEFSKVQMSKLAGHSSLKQVGTSWEQNQQSLFGTKVELPWTYSGTKKKHRKQSCMRKLVDMPFWQEAACL
jgi:hypothetical protein